MIAMINRRQTTLQSNRFNRSIMPVKIRLARIGGRHNPVYRINVANSWAPRDGKFIEDLGKYDPRPNAEGLKDISLNFQRVKYWLSVGAQPTDRVAFLLGKAGIIPEIPSMFSSIESLTAAEEAPEKATTTVKTPKTQPKKTMAKSKGTPSKINTPAPDVSPPKFAPTPKQSPPPPTPTIRPQPVKKPPIIRMI